MAAIPAVVTRTFDASVERFRRRGRRAVGWVMRMTLAAVAGFVVADLVFSTKGPPLLAPLTTMLVVQLTPVSLLKTGAQRVVSVVIGVIVAILFSSLVHITWWSLATVIALSLVIGQALRLGSNLLEVPISAMLVLGVGSRTADSAAWQRVAETLVGASVGVLSNLVFPPKVSTMDAATAMEDLADDLARLLNGAADDVGRELDTGELRERASHWLGDARRITHDIPRVGNALIRAEESRKLNLRALGTTNRGPGLRHGLEALEHSALALRSMLRSLLEVTEVYDDEGVELPRDLRRDLAPLLSNLAATVRGFGALIRADAGPEDATPQAAELEAALQRLQQSQAKLDDRVRDDPRPDTALSLLLVALLATVRRVLQEMDIERRATPDPRHSPLATLRSLPHQHGLLPVKSPRLSWTRLGRRRHPDPPD
jgi:uncharacterized membrane protein YccC